MFEILLEMNERARRLNQALEKIVVGSVALQPDLFKNVMRLVVTLIVPAAKVGAIKWMPRDFAGEIRVLAFEVPNELRNPFAFVHEAFNFYVPHMMGKSTFPEGVTLRRNQE